jgi:hypothetical protein
MRSDNSEPAGRKAHNPESPIVLIGYALERAILIKLALL